jgi:transcriptional regulator with XRE-family HTH domain
MRPFAENLKKVRNERGWSQEKASRIIGIPRSRLGSYEEDRAQPDMATFTMICAGYEIDEVIEFATGQYKSGRVTKKQLSRIEAAFAKMPPRLQKAVAIIMGLD